MTPCTPTKVARVAATTVVATSFGIGLTACSETTGDEKGVSVEDVQEEDDEFAYDGRFDSGFLDDIDSFQGRTVTLSADVGKVVSDHAFTIAGGDVEPLLVVGAGQGDELEKGSVIEVTGVIHTAFNAAQVEEQVGVDLEEDLYAQWEARPYLVASAIDTNPDTGDE